ncbi:MAG: hypothetical protein HYY17_11420 [Planctomycetes bacterium]|nr:hypothetical protein [Planctomycetota bacterium]
MRGIVVAAAWFALAATASAQDQQIGPRDMSMGGGGTSFQDEPVSLWLNPAGIATQTDQLSTSFQTFTGYPIERKSASGGGIDFSADPKTSLPEPPFLPTFLAVLFQIGDPDDQMALAVGLIRPYHLEYGMTQLISACPSVLTPSHEFLQTFARLRLGFAKNFRFRPEDKPGWFPELAVGAGVDVGWTDYTLTDRTTDSETGETGFAPGAGVGILLGVYDDGESFRVNIGAAYQTGLYFDLGTDRNLIPYFDMPQQFNAGVAVYLLKGTPLRFTFDVQFVGWEATAQDPVFPGQPRFEDAVNISVGAEYRIDLSEKLLLHLRAGYRRFQPPWEDKNDLPSSGTFKLVMEAGDEIFDIFTFGAGISWTRSSGKLGTVDVAAAFGGDSPNFALGYNHEF